MFLKTRYRILTLLIIGIVLLSAAAISIETFFTSQRQMQTSPFFVGVELGWHANLTEAKAEIDQVKSYANLLVIGTGTLTANETILNETCDYGYNAGMYLIVFWYDWNESPRKTYDSTTVGNFNENSYHPYEWIGRAKEKYGEYFLGAYYFDELGGKKLDQQETPLSYKELANNFVKNANIEPFLSLNHQVGSLLFTSDYGLYWFDYKAGYDVVLAQFGWNNSRQLQVGLARGAAAIQNKDWGVMITWTYTNTPYLETGSQLYEDLVMAYNSGAKYAVIYDASQGYSKSTLTEDHLKAMQDFWLYTQQNPQMHGCIKPDTALVLPEDYGFGFRDINDSVWGVRQTGDWHQEIYQYVTHLINEYGLRLDIVYRDIQFDNITKNLYPNPIYWTAGEKGDCLAVINVRSTMGYANIQEAINSSATYSGDTLFVKQGTYYENIVIGKSVVLLGEDENRTIIDGKNQGTALHITSNNTTVTGFTICNGGNLTTKSTGGVVLHNAFNCNITSNNIVSNNIGLLIFESANNTFRNNKISNNRFNFGVNATSLPNYINNIDISNTINGKPIHYWIKQNDQKVPSNIGYIALIDCANITIQNLEISKNYNGLLIAHSTNITLVNNIILENYEGIRIDHCLDCNLRENSMQNNIYNFGLTGRFSNSIDTSNTVNEKQLIYWINQHEKIVPNNSGLVILINCSGIIVQNLSLSNNGQGVFLYNTTNSMITQNTITYNNCGIEIFRSRNNTITKNFINNNINNGITIIVSKENDFYNNTIVSNKGDGIYLCASSNNQIRANNITNNACGIRFQNNTITNTTYNMVTENNIVRNGIFIFIQYQGAYNNTLYHDNFVNNTKQLFVSILIPGNSPMIVTGSGLTMLGITKNFWDNGSEGNYWSDYAGADTNQDGIGDTACRIRNTDYDYYPLMDPFN